MTQNSQHTVDVVIPVLNEAHVLEKSVKTVRAFLEANVKEKWNVVVVDNGSTDGTDQVAARLSHEFGDVRFLRLQQRGRGRALRAAWLQSSADVVCYMDVDLSTDLAHLPAMIDGILYEGYDLATGSRLLPQSQTARSFKREFISRAYNIFLKLVLFNRFSDAQCGFKAVSRKIADTIIPDVEDQSWFFDTELMILVEKRGFRIKDIPVKWIEDDDTRVKIFKTAWDDIKGVFRLRWSLLTGKAYRPAVTAVKRQDS